MMSATRINKNGEIGSPCLQPRLKLKTSDIKPFCNIHVSDPF